MTVVLIVTGVLLGLAGLLALVRMTNGPTILDRGVALEVLIAISICALGLHATYTRQTYVFPGLLVLSLLGFVGAVSIARYAPGADDVEADDRIDPEDEEV